MAHRKIASLGALTEIVRARTLATSVLRPVDEVVMPELAFEFEFFAHLGRAEFGPLEAQQGTRVAQQCMTTGCRPSTYCEQQQREHAKVVAEDVAERGSSP